MLRVRIISLFLVVVLAVQMLPLASIGKLIGSNQWNEELPHSITEEGKVDIMLTSFQITVAFKNGPGEHATIALNYLHISDQMPANHSIDVLSPPPDKFV